MNFFKKSLTYLGHRISEGGIETDDSKIKVICNWPTPKTVPEVRSFLGFTNYYCQFIYKYIQIIWALYWLILGENASKKNRAILWDDECEEAFRKLKEICTSTPILAYADFSKPFYCIPMHAHWDWDQSYVKIRMGFDCIIGYVCRSLSKTEWEYLVHKLEFLALNWPIMEQFHEYLYGNNFVVYTDSNPLTYVLPSTKFDATGHLWLLGWQIIILPWAIDQERKRWM